MVLALSRMPCLSACFYCRTQGLGLLGTLLAALSISPLEGTKFQTGALVFEL